MSKLSKLPTKGEIWLTKCDKIKEFSKDYCPVLIISKNLQNEFDELVVVVPLTTEDIDDIQPFWSFYREYTRDGIRRAK